MSALSDVAIILAQWMTIIIIATKNAKALKSETILNPKELESHCAASTRSAVHWSVSTCNDIPKIQVDQKNNTAQYNK